LAAGVVPKTLCKSLKLLNLKEGICNHIQRAAEFGTCLVVRKDFKLSLLMFVITTVQTCKPLRPRRGEWATGSNGLSVGVKYGGDLDAPRPLR
jgi:hypothetical protein